MKTARLLQFAAFLFGTFPAFGQGVLIYDQQSSTNDNAASGGGPILSQAAPEGQSFTPTLTSVGFVRLWSEDLGRVDTLGASIYVNLRSNSITGTILGTSDTVNFPAFVNGNTNLFFAGITNFIFSTPVVVTPGTQYFFEIVQASGTGWEMGSIKAYGYTGGDAIEIGLNQTGQDLWFREGDIGAPEPSSWALMALGGGALVVWRRRERRCTGNNDPSMVK